jgi:hypothetical protein
VRRTSVPNRQYPFLRAKGHDRADNIQRKLLPDERNCQSRPIIACESFANPFPAIDGIKILPDRAGAAPKEVVGGRRLEVVRPAQMRVDRPEASSWMPSAYASEGDGSPGVENRTKVQREARDVETHFDMKKDHHVKK